MHVWRLIFLEVTLSGSRDGLFFLGFGKHPKVESFALLVVILDHTNTHDVSINTDEDNHSTHKTEKRRRFDSTVNMESGGG